MDSESEKVLLTFRQWDANRNGFIEEDEMAAVFEHLGMDGKSARAAFKVADGNKDGRIDYEEFVAWVFDPKSKELFNLIRQERSKAEVGMDPTALVDADIPPIGEEAYHANKYNTLKLTPLERPDVEDISDWGRMPEFFTTSLQRRAPVSCLCTALAARLDIEEADLDLVYEGKSLDCELTLKDNGILEPGPAARKRGAKVELGFLLRGGVLPGSASKQKREVAKIAAAESIQRRAREIEEAEQAERLNEQRWQKWREGVVGGAPIHPSSAQMPKLNFRRLMAEFRQVQKAIAENTSAVERCEPDGENLLIWNADMSFPEDSAMQRSLEELSRCLFDESRNVLTIQARFPPEYPLSPPHIYVRQPRLKKEGSDSRTPVTFGGKFCNTLLTSRGWVPAAKMLAVFEQVREALLDVGAEVDIGVAVKSDYQPAPLQLDRVRSDRFCTMNEFIKEHMKVRSPSSLEPLLGDMSHLEKGDRIGLPHAFAQEIYGRITDGKPLHLPLLFEVTTASGRKVHCGRPEFIMDLPAEYVLLPSWQLGELLSQDDDMVRIRCVDLERITYVKIQPHNSEFYAAVKDARDAILTRSFGAYSALTEDTSVAIEIAGVNHLVQIVSLKPNGAVRLIDKDVIHDFEFKVDFDAAPDLETEEEAKERMKQLMQRYKAQQKEKEAESIATKDQLASRMETAMKKHFDHVKQQAKAAAGEDDGADGEVQIQLRLPGGKPLKAKFRDGAPVAALVALALDSEWADGCNPWGVRCINSFPRRELADDEKISKSMHRSQINVVEVKAPDNPDDIFREVDDLLNEGRRDEAPSCARTQSEVLQQAALSDINEDALLQSTLEAFNAQCLIEAGFAPSEALQRVSSGDVLQTGAGSAHGETRLGDAAATHESTPARGKEEMVANVCNITSVDPARARQLLEAARWDEAQAIAEALAPPRAPEPDPVPRSREGMIANVCNITSVDPGVAQEFLEAAGWNEARAINACLDRLTE